MPSKGHTGEHASVVVIGRGVRPARTEHRHRHRVALTSAKLSGGDTTIRPLRERLTFTARGRERAPAVTETVRVVLAELAEERREVCSATSTGRCWRPTVRASVQWGRTTAAALYRQAAVTVLQFGQPAWRPAVLEPQRLHGAHALCRRARNDR